MPITRQSIVRGPGTVTFKGATLFDASGITAEIDSSTQDIMSSIAGKLDTIKTDQIGKISLTPVGNLSNTLLDVLFPAYTRTPVIGQSVFGETDSPLNIVAQAGKKVTFCSAALTKIPELYLSPVKTAFGAAEFTALLANGKSPVDSLGFYTVESFTYADGTPPRDGLSGFHYVGTYGDLEITDTTEGWTVAVDAQLGAVTTDELGTIDYTLTGINVKAKCTPLGLSEEQILAALPTSKSRGSSISGAHDLVISASGGLSVVLKKAALVTGPLNWGASALRAGEIGFTAHIDTTDGSLYSISYSGVS